MYGIHLNSLELVLAGFILIILPALIGLGIELLDEVNKPRNRKKN